MDLLQWHKVCMMGGDELHRPPVVALTYHYREIDWFLWQHKDIENRSTQFANSDEEKAALEKIVIELRGQLQDLERIDLEKQHLEDKLKAVEEELKNTVSFICCHIM